MTDYSKLVEALRYCEFGWSARTCDNCEYSKTDCHILLSDAADAIEALQAALQAEKKKTVAQIYYEEQMAWEGRCKDLMYWIADLQAQLPKRGEIVRCVECKHRKDSIQCPLCSEGIETADDWYCADGEREVQE